MILCKAEQHRQIYRGPRLKEFLESALEKYFDVTFRHVEVLSEDELAGVHLLWLDDTQPFTEEEHDVIVSAASAGVTVVASVGLNFPPRARRRGQSQAEARARNATEQTPGKGDSSLWRLTRVLGLRLAPTLHRKKKKPWDKKEMAEAADSARGPAPLESQPELEPEPEPEFCATDVAFPDDIPDEVLLRMIRSNLGPRELCRLACTCRLFKRLAEDESAWSHLCEVHGVFHSELLNLKHSKRVSKRVMRQQQRTYAVCTTRSTAKDRYQASTAKYRYQAGGTITRGAFGTVRYVQPGPYGPYAWSQWPDCALEPVAGQHNEAGLVDRVSSICGARGGSGKKWVVVQDLRNSGPASMLVHATLVPRAGRAPGQIVLSVGAVLETQAAGRASNTALLLNTVASAAACAYPRRP